MAILPYQPAENVAEIKMTYRQGTNLMSNIYHVHNDVAWDAASLLTLQELFRDWEGDEGHLYRALSVELTYITVADLTAEDAGYSAMAVDPSIGGLLASQALPLNNSMAVTAVTGKRGRGSQGRTFWIGLTEAGVDENVVNNATVAFILGAMNGLKADVNAIAGWQLVVLHRYEDGVRLADATWTDVVTYAIRDTTVDTQKNRLPNHTRASKRTLESLCDEVIRRGGTCTVVA